MQCCSDPVVTIYVTLNVISSVKCYVRTLMLLISAVHLQCPIWLFFFGSSLISCSPGTSLRYCLNDFEMVPVAPIITGVTWAGPG